MTHPNPAVQAGAVVDTNRRLQAVCVFLLSSLLLPACGSTGGFVTAAVNTAVAVGAAGYERSQGRCYSSCVPGTRCNEETGYCDPVPCSGRCRPGEICRETAMGEQCEPWPEIEMQPAEEAP